jgi:ribosomal protein S6
MKTIADLNRKPGSKFGRALAREIQQKKQARYARMERQRRGMPLEEFRNKVRSEQ